MSENSKIEWCDHTFNPWEGCQKVGPGCDHCYAETRNARFSGGTAANWGLGAPRRRTSAANWRKPLQWNAAHDKFFAEHGRRQRVFCASLADVFDNAVPEVWRWDLMRLIRDTPNLDWLLLTKRIGNARAMLNVAAGAALDDYVSVLTWDVAPWPNVWLGATIVNQEEADRDIPKLLAAPARVRFLSMEPLLGPVEFSSVGKRVDAISQLGKKALSGIDWIIVGGESGPKARACDIQSIRGIVQQCKAAGVAVHVKQLGAQPLGWCAARVHIDDSDNAEFDGDYCDFYDGHEQNAPCPGRCIALFDKKGGDMSEWPDDLRVREFPEVN